MEWELPINAPGREITQIMLEQVTLSASAILHRQRSDHKTGNVAPRMALAHVLPIEPDTFARIAHEAVAGMGISVDAAGCPAHRLFLRDEAIIDVAEAGRVVDEQLRQKRGARRVGAVSQHSALTDTLLLSVSAVPGHREDRNRVVLG